MNDLAHLLDERCEGPREDVAGFASDSCNQVEDYDRCASHAADVAADGSRDDVFVTNVATLRAWVNNCSRGPAPDTTPPHASVGRARAELRQLSRHLRTDVDQIGHPHLASLYTTTAEVLEALDEAFRDAEAHAGQAPPAALRISSARSP